MELLEFLQQTQSEVRTEIAERLGSAGGPPPGDQRVGGYPYAESVFAEIVMEHMSEIGMTFDPNVCHYAAKVGAANLRLSGFALSEDGTRLDLFVSLYGGVDNLTSVADSETKTAAEQCLRFLARCAEGRLAASMDESNDAYVLALTIQDSYSLLDEIIIYVLTDKVAKSKNFRSREINGRTVKLEVMDIERLYRHWSAGKPRDELIVNFSEVAGSPLPCIYVKGEMIEYDYALTVIPGETLRFLYDKYGSRLLEANVRSFLGATGKVNPGIQRTLKENPERFMAFNNGIVIVTDELRLGETVDGSLGIAWLKGMQIVNGGQTTASIYFSKKKSPEIDLAKVRVPAKVVVLHRFDAASEEALISNISRFANSQNAVRQSDLSANKPFHVAMEKASMSVYTPDGVGRWFYERAAGSYKVMLAREGHTPTRLRKLKEAIPPSRKVTKTDLAKYLNAWAQKPDVVSRGSQKNFEEFTASLAQPDPGGTEIPPAAYRRMIAQTILFRRAVALLRPMFPAFQANVTAYTVALLSHRIGDRVDLDKIWSQQDISPALRALIATWAQEVNDVLVRSAAGRMISEWAKKRECWDAVRTAKYSEIPAAFPELTEARSVR
jgi:AIPR protein